MLESFANVTTESVNRKPKTPKLFSPRRRQTYEEGKRRRRKRRRGRRGRRTYLNGIPLHHGLWQSRIISLCLLHLPLNFSAATMWFHACVLIIWRNYMVSFLYFSGKGNWLITLYTTKRKRHTVLSETTITNTDSSVSERDKTESTKIKDRRPHNTSSYHSTCSYAWQQSTLNKERS